MEVEQATPMEPDANAGEVMESMGVSEDEPQKAEAAETSDGEPNQTLSVQKRLKAQKRAHAREVHELRSRIGELESRMSQPMQSTQDQAPSPYAGQPGSMDESIHKAVSYALQQKEAAENKAKMEQMQAHVYKKHQDFQRHLENMGDKYEDFHDVVMAPDANFTPVMRDYAARTMSKTGPGSAGEVLYKLGKNPDELKRIANLHPDDQAEELHKLSLALMAGGEKAGSTAKQPLGNIKSNPVTNAGAVTDKTPVGSIRQRMKQGTWK